MSCGLVCLGCRQYLGSCACIWPIPSEDAHAPLRAESGGRVERSVASKMVQREAAAQREAEEFERLPRAERRRRMRAAGLLSLALLLASPLAAQTASDEEIAAVERELGIAAADDEPAEPEAKEPSAQAPVAAAGWCAVRMGERSSEPAGDGEEGEDAEPKAPGCDIGAAVALYRWHRLALVAVLGAETVGGGVAVVAYRPPTGPAIAVALGFVMPYDAGGVYVGELAPAIGMTLSFGRAR